MIGIIDYGTGNLKSVEKAFIKLGLNVLVSEDMDLLSTCDKIVLPGVGAFADAVCEIKKRNIDKFIYDSIDDNKPFLGICLGMQMLFETSEEGGKCTGLGILKGDIKRFPDMGLKVPHIGWNNIHINEKSRLLRGIDDTFFYFVHSYYLDAGDKDDVAAVCEYGISFDAACERGNVFGVQFHPEKSSDTGLKILDNFGGMK